MLTLLHGLHAIAAQRGDGVRPELCGANRTVSGIDKHGRCGAERSQKMGQDVADATACPGPLQAQE
ncbi:hypothetical protein [Shinella sp. G-2]|uniref:hypothetical protein n=1 Tax=Shinella sp. G-2 TaxID=3133141 RepID=UPI003CFC4FF9